MSNRFHNKFHRENHHSVRNVKNQDHVDASYDPIASFESPFQGEFYSEGDIITTENLSAQKEIFAENAIIENDLHVYNNAIITNDLTVQQDLLINGDGILDGNLTIEGNLTVLGSAVELDATVLASSAVEIVNYGTGPGLTVTQHGAEPIAHFIDANGDDIIFQDNGYVGLGTYSPNEKLTVVGNISSTGDLSIAQNGQIRGDLTVSSSLFVSGNSFVGQDLTVAQNISSYGAATIGMVSNGTTDDVITKDTNNTLETRPINYRVWDTSANFLSGTLAQNLLPKFDSSNTLIDSIIYDNGAFVGINTTSPTDTFTVAGSSKFYGNVTVFGNLTATGTSTFANTLFSVTSALSVVHVGEGPAAWIGNVGTGDIASFYDVDADVEVLHVGGSNGDHPNVGIKTSEPNVDFTVNGEISASGRLFAQEATFVEQITSNGAVFLGPITISNNLITNVLDPISAQDASTKNYVDSENNTLSSALQTTIDLLEHSLTSSLTSLSTDTFSLYSTVNSNSAIVWNYQGTDLKNLSANWENTYNTVNLLSTSWEESADILPTVTNYLSTSNVVISSLQILDNDMIVGGTGSTTLYVESGKVSINSEFPNEALTVIGNISATGQLFGDGSQLSGIVPGDPDATTLVRTNSANWDSGYTTLNQISGNLVSTDTSNATPGVSAITKLLAVSALPVTQEPGTLYIIV